MNNIHTNISNDDMKKALELFPSSDIVANIVITKKTYNSKFLEKLIDVIPELNDKINNTVFEKLKKRTIESLLIDDGTATCFVCSDKSIVFAYIDCGHTICEECYKKTPKCPFCRSDKKSKMLKLHIG